jgi:hypothetical protein
MPAILIYILVVAFLIAPATLIYALVLGGIGLVTGDWRAAFSSTHLKLLAAGGGAMLLALILFFAFGKKLVVK